MTKVKQKAKSHKEERKEYTYNKLKGLGQEIIEAVEETGILIAFEEILEQKRIRHIESFAHNHPEAIEIFRSYFLNKAFNCDTIQA